MSPSLKLIFSLLLQRGMRWPLLPNGNSYTPKRHLYQVMSYQVSVRIASWINFCQMIEIADNTKIRNCKIQWNGIFSIRLQMQSCVLIWSSNSSSGVLIQVYLKIFRMDCFGLFLKLLSFLSTIWKILLLLLSKTQPFTRMTPKRCPMPHSRNPLAFHTSHSMVRWKKKCKTGYFPGQNLLWKKVLIGFALNHKQGVIRLNSESKVQ